MSPLALMCAMVLAVQAAAVKTSAVESAGAKTLERLTSEVMHGAKNASVMLGELEKMAMGDQGKGAPNKATVDTITGLLTALLANFPADKIFWEGQAAAKLGDFQACTKAPSKLPGLKKALSDARDEATTCRDTSDGDLHIHTLCGKLDTALSNVADAVETLDEAYPVFPGVDEVIADSGKLKRVDYVEKATNSKICQAADPTIPDQWSSCQGETIQNYEKVGDHKTACLTKHKTFELNFCTWRMGVRTELEECKTFKDCQGTAKENLDKANTDITKLDNSRKLESLAVKKIVCYLTQWQLQGADSEEGAAGMAACLTQTLTEEEISTLTIAQSTCTGGGCTLGTCTYTATAADVARANIFPNGDYTLASENEISAKFVTDEYGTKYQQFLYTKDRVPGTAEELHSHEVYKCPDFESDAMVFTALLFQAHDSTPIAAKPIAAEKPKSEKKLVRREPKKAKASLAELDHQGHMTNVKVQASKHSTTELHDMDMDALMELVKTSGANTAAIKAAMTKSIMKLQAQASAV